MKFSNMKMLKKILSLVLALCTTAALFAGCSKKPAETLPEDSQPEFTLPTETTPPETEPMPTETEPINEKLATVLNELHIRSSPSNEAVSLGTLNPGDKVEIIQETTGLAEVRWGYIALPGSSTDYGWICMDFVEYDYKPAQPDAPQDGTDETKPEEGSGENTGNGSTSVIYKGIVTTNELNIRKTPDKNGDKVGTLRNGTRVDILERDGNWGRIDQGWISLDYVKIESTENKNDNKNNGGNTNVDGNGSTTVIARGIVNTANLNVRSSPSVEDDNKVGSLSAGTRVEILEKQNGWGRVKQGWIAMNYVYIDGTGTGNNKTGTVTADDLRIRSGPGTGYGVVGSLSEGDSVTILYRVTAGGMTWGNIKQGWISMDYVELDDPDDEDDGDNGSSDGITWEDAKVDKGNGSTSVIAKGIVTADKLNIRSSASSDGDKVGSLSYGARVEILEKDSGWARIKQGWIDLDYVYQDGTGDGGEYGTATTGLFIRSGPGTNYGTVGSLEEGDEVTILFELEVGGMTWGNTEDGWVAMKYIDKD